jgi:hypothetical protein
VSPTERCDWARVRDGLRLPPKHGGIYSDDVVDLANESVTDGVDVSSNRAYGGNRGDEHERRCKASQRR